MAKKRRNEIRESRKSKLLGTLAGWFIKMWTATLRYEFEDRSGYTSGKFPGPVILALWHNRILAIAPLRRITIGKERKISVLASASHDGAMLAHAMAVFDFGAIRGSSSRRGAAALVALIRTLREGTDVCFTPDGPRGPRYGLQPGLVKLAESTRTPIIPMNASFSSAWRLKTWDRFVIPKPFSRVRVWFGEAIIVPPDLDEASFAAECKRVEGTMRAATDDL